MNSKSRPSRAPCDRPDPTTIAEYADGILQGQDRERFERHLSVCRTCLDALRGLYEDRHILRHHLPAALRETPQSRVRLSLRGLERMVRSSVPAFPLLAEEAAGSSRQRRLKAIRFETSRGPVVLSSSGTRAPAVLDILWNGGRTEVRKGDRLVGKGTCPLSLPIAGKGDYRIIADRRTVLTLRLF